jgi:hypothetical protein
LGVGLALLACLTGPALAVQPDEVMKDPALETRARALSAELRCLVCQNQSIDDSDAPLARDIRILTLVAVEPDLRELRARTLRAESVPKCHSSRPHSERAPLP